MKIIDNKKIKLLDILSKRLREERDLIKTVKIASGFLFLDGWTEFKNAVGLKDIINENPPKFKIVFKYTDTGMGKLLLETFSDNNKSFVVSQYIQNLLSKTDLDKLEVIKEDLEKLKNKKLIEFKINKNLHSKLYLILTKESDDEVKGYGYVGSSNFTKRGLALEGELNVEITDIDNLKKLNDWFEELWKSSEKIDANLIIRSIRNVILRKKQSGLVIDPKRAKGLKLLPIDLFLFVLWYLLDGVLEVKQLKEIMQVRKEFPIKKHNEEAVLSGYYRVINLRGVILADPVGLGKSFQALGIFELLRLTDKTENLLLIAPPHLIENDQWVSYIKEFYGEENVKEEEFGLIEKYISNYKYLRVVDKKGEFKILILSSYGISTISEITDTNKELFDVLSEYKTIIIDEAHHFKNIHSKKRKFIENLRDYIRNKTGENPYFILLTATPIINDINELFSLISIYTNDGELDLGILVKSTYGNVSSLIRKLYDFNKKLRENKVDNKLKREIMNLIDKVIIMRSRKYIYEKFYNEQIMYPELENIEYDYKDIKPLLDYIDNLNLSFLDLIPADVILLEKYEFNEEGRLEISNREVVTLIGIMKLLLIKRLESSIYAFLNTLRKLKRKEEEIKDILKEYINNNKDLKEAVMDLIEVLKEDKVSEFLIDLKMSDYSIDEEYVKSQNTQRNRYNINLYIQHIEDVLKDKNKVLEILYKINKDLEVIDHIEDMLRDYESFSKITDKEEKLLSLIKKFITEEKSAVIFTMYKDTAEYLINLLKEKLPDYADNIYLVTGDTKNKGDIVTKFKNRIKEKSFTLLISTDTLSEGVNLKEVHYLINYDIPWTPSILMQRIGRLWRFGRAENFTYYNFLPTESLFDSIIKKVEEKIKIIKEILVQEINLLRKGEVDLLELEYKVYGALDKDKEKDYKLIELLREFSERKYDKDKDIYDIIINFLEEKEFKGRKLIERVRRKECLFKKLKKDIDGGKIVNLFSKELYKDSEELLIIAKHGENILFYEEYDIINNNLDKIYSLLEKKFEKIKRISENKIFFYSDYLVLSEDFLTKVRRSAIRSYVEYLLNFIKTNTGTGSWLSDLIDAVCTMIRQRTLEMPDDEFIFKKYRFLLFLCGVALSKSKSRTRELLRNILKEKGILNNNNRLNEKRLLEFIMKRDKFESLFNRIVNNNNEDKDLSNIRILFLL